MSSKSQSKEKSKEKSKEQSKEDVAYLTLVQSLVPAEAWKNYFSQTSASEMKKEIGVPVKGSNSQDSKTKTALFLRTRYHEGKWMFQVDDLCYPPYHQEATVAGSLLRSVQPGETLIIEGEGGPYRYKCVYPMKTVLEFQVQDKKKALFKMVDKSNPWCFVEFQLDFQWMNGHRF